MDRIVAIDAGRVRGLVADGVARFLNLPYAAPPVGSRRFAAPEPPAPWPGVRDACAQGPTAPQSRTRFPDLDVAPLIGAAWRPGDDYLNLNLWAPAEAEAGAALPVMVFVHGGAFVLGGNDAAVHDGSGFARSGIVCVAINYRLGIDGFLPISGVLTNLGLRDQIAALAWVRANVAAFGGDPANVTVFGESAGAMSVATLIASPAARGLFRRAIVQSGHGAMVRSAAIAARVTRALARDLGVTPDRDGFAAVGPEAGLAAVERISRPRLLGMDLREADGCEPAFGLSRFLPVLDQDIVPRPPHLALADGVGAEIEVLIGTNAEEVALYFVPGDSLAQLNAPLAWLLLSRVRPHAWALLRAYGLGRRGVPTSLAFTRAMTDLVFRLPALRFAAAHCGRTHVYCFDWRSPAFGGRLGAAHGVEMPFVFNTLACCSGPRGLLGIDPPQALADRVHGIWAEFARSGHLPWDAWQKGREAVFALTRGEAGNEAPMPAARFC